MVEQVINRGDVFWADIEYNGTSIQGGVRPVVIVSNQQCNRYSSIISAVCLTTSKTKSLLPTHVSISARKAGLKQDSICLCEQPMSIAKSKLIRFLATLTPEDMRRVEDGLRCQLGL